MVQDTPRGSEAAILVKRLTKRYGKVVAVDDISFSVERGSVTGLLGGNGAGKTTTIAMLLGIVLPTSGAIAILGDDMLAHRYRLLPRMNFQSPYVDMPHRLTVTENLTVISQLNGARKPRDRELELARDLDLEPFLKRPTGQLSAGQKTRVALAKALINRPELLLLDEPTASLDPDTADWVRSYLARYKAERGATILLASHNMVEVERLADHVLMMRGGRIVARGAPTELLTRFGRRTMEEVFLDMARNRQVPEPLDAAE
jgi:ABC-2 type transport system ATP-binding protein